MVWFADELGPARLLTISLRMVGLRSVGLKDNAAFGFEPAFQHKGAHARSIKSVRLGTESVNSSPRWFRSRWPKYGLAG